VELSSHDVRNVRFGTTRMRAGYEMAEVDAFLDTIEAAVETYVTELQHSRDEADALRSQVQQIQGRLASVQAELDECRALGASQTVQDGHDTIVTEIKDTADVETTAETPIVGSSVQQGVNELLRVREDVRRMLTEQLKLVDELNIESR
jgi:DivIVA domain-containing protein